MTLVLFYYFVSADCEDHRDHVDYDAISKNEFTATNLQGLSTPIDIFYGSPQDELQELNNDELIIIIDLKHPGTKQLISLSFLGENIESVKVRATADNGDLSDEIVSTFYFVFSSEKCKTLVYIVYFIYL